MKQLKHLIVIFLLTLGISITNGYFFGIKSDDNTISNILDIQNQYELNFDVIGFIFDPRSEDVLWIMNNLNNFLGTGKIYHITLSPNSYSAKQVYEGAFDDEYKKFFKTIKENDLKVIFRTMHEMNGGRYPRGSNPEEFKKAWIHVRELSRAEGLNQNNILFDFSVNHQDMPTNEMPSQNAKLITCNKYKTDCYKFEDYYPGDDFVDVIGVTFYNRGKATYNRLRKSPSQILNDKNRNTLTRLKSLNKPIIIDEVGTTAVRYDGNYNFLKSKKTYDKEYSKKNERLHQLNEFIKTNPEILGMIYFNTDYTNGLTKRIPGEADRSIINLKNDKIYYGIYELYNDKGGENTIKNLFKKIEEPKTIYISKKQKKELAELMIEKFGREESKERLTTILKYSKNENLTNLIYDLIKLIEN